MNTILKTNDIYRIAISDILILALVYFLPALMHLSSLPLYLFEPMRIFVFLGYILSGNKVNAYVLALTIPLFSFITAGHPPIFKAVLISAELFLNIWLYIQFSEKGKWHASISLFFSIIVSKIVYYGLKYAFLSLALIDGSFVGIPFAIQLMVAVFLSVVISFFLKKNNQTGQ